MKMLQRSLWVLGCLVVVVWFAFVLRHVVKDAGTSLYLTHIATPMVTSSMGCDIAAYYYEDGELRRASWRFCDQVKVRVLYTTGPFARIYQPHMGGEYETVYLVTTDLRSLGDDAYVVSK